MKADDLSPRASILNKLLDLSLVLAVFVAPISVILNKIFGGSYLYFSALPDLLISACFAAALALKFKAGGVQALKPQNRLDVLIWLYLGLSLIYFLVGFFYQNNILSLGQGFLSAARFALVYLSFRMADFKFSNLSKKMIKFSLLLILIFGLIQFIFPNILNLIGYADSPIKAISTVDGTKLNRVQSLLRGPNPYGAFLLIPFSLALFKFKQFKNKKMAAEIIFLIALNLGLTWSRSAWLGAVVIIGFFILTKLKLSKKMIIAGFFTVLISISALSLVARTDSFKTVLLHDKPGVGGGVTSDQDRLGSYSSALSLIKSEPLGLGLSSAGPASVRSNSGANIVENYFLQIFLQLGWAGGTLFIAITALSLIRLVKAKSDLSLGLAASGAALSLVGLMQPVWVDASVVFVWWSLLAMELNQL